MPYNITDVEVKYCKRCGRRLKSPEAIEKGYGKICLKKAQTETGKALFKIGVEKS